VSLQERVKFGGHETSVTKYKRLPHSLDPFYFFLQFSGPQPELQKRQFMAAEIERQESMYRRKKVTSISKHLQERKKIARNKEAALKEREEERLFEEHRRREMDATTMQQKYFDHQFIFK